MSAELHLTKIKLGDNADTSKNFVISVPAVSDGTLTIERENGTDVLTIDASGNIRAGVGGNLVGNGPAFSAYQSSAQILSNNRYTKINLQSEEFDTANAFDPETSRFQPTIAGYYWFSFAIGFVGGPSGLRVACLYKNGASLNRLLFVTNPVAGDWFSASGGVLAYLNGTTDYVELFGFQASGGNLSLNTNITYLQGVLVRAA